MGSANHATTTPHPLSVRFLMGAGVGLLIVPAQTLIQSETPLPMAGRVSSAVTSLDLRPPKSSASSLSATLQPPLSACARCSSQVPPCSPY